MIVQSSVCLKVPLKELLYMFQHDNLIQLIIVYLQYLKLRRWVTLPRSLAYETRLKTFSHRDIKTVSSSCTEDFYCHLSMSYYAVTFDFEWLYLYFTGTDDKRTRIGIKYWTFRYIELFWIGKILPNVSIRLFRCSLTAFIYTSTRFLTASYTIFI